VTRELSATVKPATASQAVTWKSSNTTIATVDADGQVTFTGKAGTVTITATAADGSKKAGTKTYTVKYGAEYFAVGLGDMEFDADTWSYYAAVNQKVTLKYVFTP